LRSNPWECAGEAGWEKKFEVEERLPASPPSSRNRRELALLAEEEIFRVKSSMELRNHHQQKREAPFPRLRRAMGH